MKTPMGKTSTLIYLYSNFDNSQLVSSGLDEVNSSDLDHIIEFIEENTKKVPDGIVNNVIEFAKNYS